MDTDKLLIETLQKLAKIEALMETDLKGVKEDVDKMNTKLDNLTEKLGRVDELETRQTHLEERLNKIDNTMTWIARTIGGIMIAGAMFVVFGIKA